MALLVDLATRSAALLTQGTDCHTAGSLAAGYRDALACRGFTKGSGRVVRTRVANAFATFSAPLVAALPEVADFRWAGAMAGKHRRSFHTLHHVLFEAFLDQAPVVSSPRPFGNGPWPCLNPLADHHGQAVVGGVVVRLDRGRCIGRFACACGYVYDREAGSGDRPRPVCRGPMFEARLRLLTAEGKSLSHTARALKVGHSTVHSHALRLGLPMPWKRPESADAHDPAIRAAMRQQWRDLSVESPTSPRRALAKRMPEEHNWLYRHDRRWLLENSLDNNPWRTIPQDADWTVLDTEFAAALTGMVEALTAAVPLQRVTLTRLRRHMGLPAWAVKNRDRLPGTTTLLENALETVEAFQLRRVAHVVANLGASSQPPAWKLRQLAGLPQRTSPAVAAAINAHCRAPVETPPCP